LDEPYAPGNCLSGFLARVVQKKKEIKLKKTKSIVIPNLGQVALNLSILIFLVSFLFSRISSAQGFSCRNIEQNVIVVVNAVSDNLASIEVISPFQKKMMYDMNDYSNGREVIRGFACDNGDDLPDVLAIDQNSKRGMIEVSGQPHYELTCAPIHESVS
jgi:hypothetical protein